MFEYLVEKAERLDKENLDKGVKAKDYTWWYPYNPSKLEFKYTSVDFRTNGLVFDDEGSLVASWSEYD